MTTKVNLVGCMMGELLVTLSTSVRLNSQVDVPVSRVVSLHLECLVADVTLEGALCLMHSHVDLQSR